MHILEKKTYVKPSVAVLGLVEEGHLCAYSKGEKTYTIPTGKTEEPEETENPPKDKDGYVWGD